MNQILLDLLSKFLQIVGVGGWMVLPLVLTSIFTLALVFEQFWYILLANRRIKKLLKTPDDINQIQGMDMVSRMVSWLKKHPQTNQEECKQHLEYIYNHFERRISWLNTMAAIAPLLGLLGTVSGMINIFAVVSVKKPTNPLASLSGGISEALFATGGGLLIAILAAFAYQYLQSKLEALGEAINVWYKDYQLALPGGGVLPDEKQHDSLEAYMPPKEPKKAPLITELPLNTQKPPEPPVINAVNDSKKAPVITELPPKTIVEPSLNPPQKEMINQASKQPTQTEIFDYNVQAKSSSSSDELFDYNVKANKKTYGL